MTPSMRAPAKIPPLIHSAPPAAASVSNPAYRVPPTSHATSTSATRERPITHPRAAPIARTISRQVSTLAMATPWKVVATSSSHVSADVSRQPDHAMDSPAHRMNVPAIQGSRRHWNGGRITATMTADPATITPPTIAVTGTPNPSTQPGAVKAKKRLKTIQPRSRRCRVRSRSGATGGAEAG